MQTFTQQARTILLVALLLALGYAPGYGETVNPSGTGKAAVLDDFNRADGTNMGANWTEAPGGSDLAISSARVTVYLDGTTVKEDIDTNFDGVADQRYSYGSAPARNGTSVGLGISGSTQMDNFGILALPTVTNVNPASGPQSGGNSVTITGTNFTGATGVTFDGLDCPITSNNGTEIVCTAPAHGPGAVSVIVTTPGGTNVANSLYTYIQPPQVALTFSGGNGTPLSMTLPQSVVYTLNNSACVGTNIRPNFVFDEAGNIFGSSFPAVSGTITFSVNGGSQMAFNRANSGVALNDISVNDIYLYNASAVVSSIPTASTIVLNAGTLTTANNYAGAPPANGSFTTFIVNTNASQCSATGIAVPNLSINDVTQLEGNAGTSTFQFTVSLSSPAPAGGVTFDIATADNTATTGDNDYAGNSLTGQTIAAGNSTATFNVTVNGDTNVEPTETFFVNVTNVTGATVTDGQGQGTITNDDIPNSTLIVTKTADTNDGVCDADCSLREAIAAAASGDVIEFASPLFDSPQTITLGSQLTIDKSLTINGTGANLLAVSGNNASRVFNINGGANVTINGITITGGRITGANNGGGILNSGTLSLNNCVVSNNSVSVNGGGIHNSLGTLNLTNCTVSNNSANNGGGGISSGSGNVTLVNTTLSNNSANSGGGFSGTGTLNLTNSTVSSNSAPNAIGGGILIVGTLNARNSIISGNTAASFPNLSGSFAVNNSNIVDNEANVRLAPLGFYGGATMTHALLSGSTAINAGNNCVLTQTCTDFNAPIGLTTDQRGASRIGQVDIGAFELNNSANGGNFRAQLPAGKQFVPYNYTIIPNIGSIISVGYNGSFPFGVFVNQTNALVAQGTPNQSGTFNFSITLDYGGNSFTTDYSVQIAPASADLSITKTDGVTTAVPGGSVTYTITASNAGPDAVTGATVADTFPAAITSVNWTCVGAGGGTCPASGSGNINRQVNLPAGGSVTFTATAAISPSATGNLVNTATVSSAANDPNPANNSATDTDTPTPRADLAITKTNGVTSVQAGGTTTYTITASNAGPGNAPGATVADTFPAAITSATWTCVGAGGGTCTSSGAGNISDMVNLPVGASVTYTVNANISSSATETLSNTATVAAPAGVTDPTPGNNSATDTDTMLPLPSLGNYPNTGVDLSGNTTISPDAVPLNAIYATATTTADFKGELEVDPATGIVRVTNAHPAGIYPVTVRAFGAGGTARKTFDLTVSTPSGCNTFGATAFAPAVNYSTGSSNTDPSSIAVGDFNGDGRQDIAAANGFPGINYVSVFLRNAANDDFEARVDYPAGNRPRAIAVGDLNGDGREDIIAGNRDGNISVLYRNAANNGFDAPFNLPVADNVNTLAVGDLNGDGKPDIAATISLTSTVSVYYRNSGNTGFDPRVDLTATLGPNGAAIADFSGDGRADLVVVSAVGSASLFYRNAGNTEFDPAVNIALPTNNGMPVAAGDFNGDGRQDFAVGYVFGNFVSVYLRTADNTGFDAPVNLTVNTITGSIAVGDFNYDGRQDIATVNSTGSSANILLRSADNTGFDSPVSFGVGSSPRSVAVGDFNGDNRQDLVSANANSHNISVLTRICDATPPVITPTVSGTLGNNDWYTSDVQVSWSVTDAESTVSNQTGCATQTVTMDTEGVTFTCSATSAGGMASRSVTVKRDATAPANAVSNPVNVTTAGGTSHSIPVLYNDANAIDVGTFDNGDIRVTGPNGFDMAASYVSVDIGTNGSPRTATYSITPPNGSWDFADNGSYDVSMQVSAVSDVAGNAVPAGTIGSFRVSICPPIAANIDGNNGPVCVGGDATFTVSGTAGAILTYTLTGQSNQTLTLTGTNQTITASNVTANVTLTLVSVEKDGCSQSLSGTSTVTVNALPTLTPGPNKLVILGYGSNCTELTATATGTGPFTYAWSGGASTTGAVQVCPQATTDYTVRATDGRGCVSAEARVRVTVQDVRCGNKNQNVTVCYYGVTQCVSAKVAERYLKLGATLGACGSGVAARVGADEGTSEGPLVLSVGAYPNPVADAVWVEVLAPQAGSATLQVLDVAGRVRQSRRQMLSEGRNEVELRLGSLPTGVYVLRVLDAAGRQATVRVSKE